MASATPTNEQTLIRWSHAWWIYMIARGGFLLGLVNGLENTLAIVGRTLLLVFLLYGGVKSGALLVDPSWAPPGWLEMFMFGLQLGGLEGSVPGLARRADDLHAQNEHEAAKQLERIMRSARAMTILTIGEGVLHLFGIDPSILRIISGVLLLVRGVVITGFLIELAKIDARGPRVLSRSEHEREQQRDLLEGEQAQTIASLTTQLENEQGQVEQLRVQLEGLPDLKQALEDKQGLVVNLQGQLSIEQRTVSTLRLQLEAEQERFSTLQEELTTGQGDTSTLRKQLNTASIDLDTLRAQLEGKDREIESLKTTLTGSHEMQETRVKQLLTTEQERVTRLRQELESEQERTSTLHRELQTAKLQISTLTTEQERATNLQGQLATEQEKTADLSGQLQTAKLQISTLSSGQEHASHLQDQLQTEQETNLTLRQQLGTTNLQIVDLSAKLEAANLQVGNLQKTVDETANLPAQLEEKDQELGTIREELRLVKQQIKELRLAKSQPAKPSDQPAKITSIETAKSGRKSHAEVLAYMDANPSLKRSEVAANLGISERKVYDAIAWGKEQEEKVEEA